MYEEIDLKTGSNFRTDCYCLSVTEQKPLVKNNSEYTFTIVIWRNKKAVIMDTLDFNIFRNGQFIGKIERNYCSIPYAFAQQNEEDFLITSEDYQCITIFNLTTGIKKTYGDKKALEMGIGFCPSYFEWYEDENKLITEGCIWACPFGTMTTYIPDLNNPDFNTAEFKY